MKTNARLTALLLAILLLVLSCQLPAFAATDGEELESIPQVDSTAATPPDTTLTNPDEMQLQPGDKTQAELQTMTLDPATVPEVLSYTAAQQKGHVNRIYAQEKNLNTVAFQNVDGTKTAYIYNSPVKYVDSTGNVRDKSTALTQQSNGYAMLDNSVRAYFSQNVTNGICVEYDDYQITMTPSTTDMSAPILQDGRLVYANVFNRVTLLSYQTKLNGVKEEIIAVKDAGQYDYEFTLDLQGLMPVKIDGIWYLKNSQDEIIADLGEVLIADSAGNTATGSMQIEADTAQNTYTLTITVPQDFMQASTTVYPVYIDPTVTVDETGTYIYSGEDGDTVYETKTAITDIGVYHSITPTFANRHEVGYEQGYVIYHLYDFFGDHGQFVDLEYYKIGKVTLYLYVDQGNETEFVTYPMTTDPLSTYGGIIDVLDGVTYINLDVLYGSYDCDTFSTTDIDASEGIKAVDITTCVKSWASVNSGSYTNNDASYGLLLTSGSHRRIRTSDYSSGNDVYYQVDYDPSAGWSYINHNNEKKLLRLLESSAPGYHPSFSHYTEAENNYFLWLFEYQGNGQYYIKPCINPFEGSGSAAVYATQVSCDQQITIQVIGQENNDPNGFLWEIKYDYQGGSYFQSAYPTSQPDTSKYVLSYSSDGLKLKLRNATNPISTEDYWTRIAPSHFTYLPTISTTEQWIGVGESTLLTIDESTVTNLLYRNQYYTWTSLTPGIASISDTGVITTHQPGVAIIKIQHIPTGNEAEFYITVGQIFNDYAIHYIENRQSKQYLEVKNASTAENESVQTTTPHENAHAKWVLHYDGNGYYTITSLSSGKYLSIDQTSNQLNAPIVQNNQVTRWKILATKFGAYRLISASVENNDFCLGTSPSSTASNDDCIRISYTPDENLCDEWWLIDTERILNIIVKVDQTYQKRYPSVDPENVNNAHYRVNETLKIVQAHYYLNFNAYINWGAIDYQYESFSDPCLKPMSQKCDGTCPDLQSGQSHSHAQTILEYCEESVTTPNDYTPILLFNGRVGYADFIDIDNIEREVKISGYRHDDYDKMMAVVMHFSSIYIEANTIAHELGHCFGTVDHYDDPNPERRTGQCYTTDEINQKNNTTIYNDYCTYGYLKSDNWILKNNTICPGCYSVIKSNIEQLIYQLKQLNQ